MTGQIINPKKNQLERWRRDGYKEGFGPGTSGQVVRYDSTGTPQAADLFPSAATAFTPTLSSTGGAAPGAATPAGWWFQVGKMLWVEYNNLITTAAPATFYVTATLPNSLSAVRQQFGIVGREAGVSGKALVGNANGTTVTFFLADNGITAVNGYNLFASGWVEVA